MAILNNKNFSKKSQNNSDIFVEDVQRILETINTDTQPISIDTCERLILRDKDLFFSLLVSQDLLKKLISYFYKVNKKNDAYECVALLALHNFSKANMIDYLFTIAKLAYDNGDFDFAKGYIKTVYILSDGAYFCSNDSKKMLNCVDINDNRTFEDYCEDY